MTEHPAICVAILNWNGVEHLKFLLPTVRRALENYPGEASAFVLDNASENGDSDWVREAFPDFQVWRASRNQYLFSYNQFCVERAEDLVVLLNNDLRVHPDFLTPMVRYFRDPNIFAVGGRQRDWEDTRDITGPVLAHRHHGYYYFTFDTSNQAPSYTFFASGGFVMIDRRKFLELGGFDQLFHPGYGEDLDLCYRAWLRGWQSVYEPEALVWHRVGGSFDLEQGRSEKLIRRASLLFSWRHLLFFPESWLHHIYLRWLSLRQSRQWRAPYCDAWKRWKEMGPHVRPSRNAKIQFEWILRKCGKPVDRSLHGKTGGVGP